MSEMNDFDTPTHFKMTKLTLFVGYNFAWVILK